MSAEPRQLFHIMPIDRLAAVVADGYLWSDARHLAHGAIVPVPAPQLMAQRRLTLPLQSHPGLHVGECVSLSFSPRSVALYFIWQAQLSTCAVSGGETSIVHLQADLRRVVAWAEEAGRRWAFTLSSASTRYVEDRHTLEALEQIDWDAVDAYKWAGAGIPASVKEGKQAEFLIEDQFPWHLVERIGVKSRAAAQRVAAAMGAAAHRPVVEIRQDWYYGSGAER